MRFYVDIEDEDHIAGITKAREQYNASLPQIDNPDYVEPNLQEWVENPDYEPPQGDPLIENPDYVPAQEGVGEPQILNPDYDEEDEESEQMIDNPDYVEATEAVGEPMIENPDYVAPVGEALINNPDYTEGTPDLPKMIEDEGFTEDKDYMKWVIEKAAESYAKEFGIID